MKLSPLIPAASGKIGGHSISNTRNGIVMKTIKQPRRKASRLQSVQRFVTADITNKWQFLTPGQHAAWNNTASNYPYINNLGEPATRNGFQTFCFLNQNRHILELPILEDPPVYEPILKPFIYRQPSDETDLVLKGSNLKNSYSYVVYVQIHYSVGANTFEQTPLIVAILTAAQLTDGYNLVPDIKNTYATATRVFRVSVQTIAIDTISGNRDLTPKNIIATIPSPALDIDILSYYPFETDAEDYFGVNDAVYTGTAFDLNGKVKGQAIFTGSIGSYISLGNNSSLNFPLPDKVGDFTILFWYRTTEQTTQPLFTKKYPNSVVPYRQYLGSTASDSDTFSVFETSVNRSKSVEKSKIFQSNKWIFYTAIFKSPKTPQLYINGVQWDSETGIGLFTNIRLETFPLEIGRLTSNPPQYFKGEISELVLINGAINVSVMHQIMAANENGLTILDII